MPQRRATTAEVMSLSDIAALAHVQRAVVSTWRRRPVVRGAVVPFPEPVEIRAGVELFSMAEVVAWLGATKRGNNPEAAADALAHARPIVRLDDEVMRAALEALLCLKARTGLDLCDTSPAEIVSTADEVDPEDNHLVRELVAAGDELAELAEYAERLADALWDATTAYARVRARKPVPQADLTPEALDLLGTIGAAVALDAERDIVITDVGESDPDLVDSVLTHLGEGAVAHVLVGGGSPADRSARRLHWTRGRSVVDVAPKGALPLVITRIPRQGGATDPASILAAADDIQLDLHEQQRALVIGPASVLCDGLGSVDLDQQRDHFIRLGRLRCALRLPHGLVSDGSRMVLGLWVVGGEPASVKVEARRMATADLTNVTLRPDVVDDIATDVVASLSDVARATHAFRFARLHATSTLLAGQGAVVAPGAGPDRVPARSGAASAVSVRQRMTELRVELTSSDLLDGFTVEPSEGSAPHADLSIDEAVRAGLAYVQGGSRLDPAPQSSTGVRVIDADAVRDPTRPRRGLDPLDLEIVAPRARRTEPGDVVFCTSPRPAALVDDVGLSVVAYPARVLRCTRGGGLVPEAVAQAINDLPPRSPHWRAWRIPRVPTYEADALSSALRQLAVEEARARDRIARLSELAYELSHGVATGALTISTDPIEEGH